MKKQISVPTEKKPVKTSRQKKGGHTLIVDITPEKYFAMCDGRKVKDYRELADILRIVNDDIFRYHVNDQRNDFASWISDVFNERDLAKRIQGISGRLETSLEIYKHLFEKLEKLSKKN